MKQICSIHLLPARLMLFALVATSTLASDAIPDSLVLASPWQSNEGICEIDQVHWKTNSIASSDDPFIISTWFQGGSGRYWQIAIRNRGNLGICLTSSTIGFRSLQRFDNLPLPWARDLDGDGVNEFIFWYSFALGPTIDEGYGLSVKVYQQQSNSVLSANQEFTDQLINQIMAAYRLPINGASGNLQRQRRNALHKLKVQLSSATTSETSND